MRKTTLKAKNRKGEDVQINITVNADQPSQESVCITEMLRMVVSLDLKGKIDIHVEMGSKK